MGDIVREASDGGLHGGLVDSIGPHLVGTSESPDTENLDPRSLLGATTRNGRSQYGIDNGSDAKVAGLKAWSRSLGTSYVVGRVGTTFYNITGASWASIGIGGDDADRFTASPLDDNLVIAVDGLAPQKWDGTTWGTLGGSPPSEAKYCVVHISKVWLAGDDSNPQTKYFSATNNAEDYTATDDAGSITTQEGGGDRILGLAANRIVLLTFYRRFVDVLTGYSTINFSEQRLADRGLVSETGYISAGDVVFFASDDAIYMVAGTRISDITTMKVRESYQAISDKSKISLGVKGDLLLVVDYASENAWACDWKRNVWSEWTGQEWEVMSTANDGTFYGGTSDASTVQVWKLDTGSLDDAATITAKWRTPNLGFGWPESIKNMNKFYVHAKPGLPTVTVNFFKNGTDTGASAELAFASTGDHDWEGRRAQVEHRGTHLGLQMSWTGQGTMYGWAIYATVTTGQGKIPVEA